MLPGAPARLGAVLLISGPSCACVCMCVHEFSGEGPAHLYRDGCSYGALLGRAMRWGYSLHIL